MTKIEITIAGLPPTPNKKMHWAIKAKLNKQWRLAAFYIAKNNAPLVPFKTVELTFIRGSTRKADLDNCMASMKPIIDGLKDALIFKDDNPEVVRSIRIGYEKAPRGKGYVKIIIQSLE